MTRIALLINQEPEFTDGNNMRFASALHRRGMVVDVLFIDTLQLEGGRVSAKGFQFNNGHTASVAMPPGKLQPVDHDLVWLLGLGDRTSFLDKYQLLYALPDYCQLINSLESVMHLKSKYFLASHADRFPNPETHASANADELIAVVRAKGGDWIVKPPAGSLGVDVYRVSDDVTLESTLSQLCGPDNNRYVLLQRYVPEIEQGEKRVLIAGGKVIGQYLRTATEGKLTNLNQGAKASACELTAEEFAYCEKLGKGILAMGAYFAGIDLTWPWLIEINVINPGGITTIDELTGVDLTESTIGAVLEALPDLP